MTVERADNKAATGGIPFTTLRRWVFGGALVILLGLGLIKSLRASVADILILDVRAVLNDWDNTGAALADWVALREQIEAAMQLTPGNSEQYRLLGLAYEWRFFLTDSPVEAEADLIAFRQAAIDAHRQSALLRPAWPLGWANLARQKAILGEEDAELLLALDRALALGPNEAQVRHMVTDAVTLTWPYVEAAPATREAVIRMIETSLLPPQTDDTLQHLLYIIERNMQPELCPLLNLDMLAEWAREACAPSLPATPVQ